jgi:purine-nucleoside phosphorylase
MPTPHNSAMETQIAKSVLFPGDPVRARYIATEFLENAVQVTDVRNITGFTGTWKGQTITVMASGMGGPSAGIYSYELYNFYGVERIIRIGTAGGLRDECDVGSLVIALSVSTDSSYASQYRLSGTFSPCADFSLLEKAVAAARTSSADFHVGPIFSSDFFSEYNALGPELSWKPWARMGCLAQDMETYSLYCNAAWLGKKALSIVTITDSCVTGTGLNKEDRMPALHPMIEIALEAAI